MEIGNIKKIGTHFNKKNIFLATVSEKPSKNKKIVKSDFLKSLTESIISSEQFDIFYYEDNKGYTRFLKEGPETFVGDNSDGKGTIKNIVSIWDYYSEEQIVECLINGKFLAISCLDIEPLYKYNEDYNLS